MVQVGRQFSSPLLLHVFEQGTNPVQQPLVLDFRRFLAPEMRDNIGEVAKPRLSVPARFVVFRDEQRIENVGFDGLDGLPEFRRIEDFRETPRPLDCFEAFPLLFP